MMHVRRKEIFERLEAAGEIRIARIEFRCKICRKWHGVGTFGLEGGDNLRMATLDHYANSGTFGCYKLLKRCIRNKANYNSQKRHDDYIKHRPPLKPRKQKVKKPIVIHEERFMGIIKTIVGCSSLKHRDELISVCNLALVKAARSFEKVNTTEVGFPAYARVALNHAVNAYFNGIKNNANLHANIARTNRI